MSRALMVSVAVLATSCMTPEAALKFQALPEGEKSAWDACYPMVQGKTCPGAGPTWAGIAAGQCMNSVAERYAMLETPAARRETLVSLGCPAPVVDQATAAR
jgi:hypothetical protein